jgi:Mn-containing catalase
MNNRVKSLEIRDEVINLIEEKFEIVFGYSYNDLYKIKDNGLVRRLKGFLMIRENNNFLGGLGVENKEYNDKIIEIDNFVKNLDYKGFEIKLKKRMVYVEERDREYYERYNNCIISMKELRDIEIFKERELILSIRFKDK